MSRFAKINMSPRGANVYRKKPAIMIKKDMVGISTVIRSKKRM
jgi:hypothetical protein